jgi:hypothetical protein
MPTEKEIQYGRNESGATGNPKNETVMSLPLLPLRVPALLHTDPKYSPHGGAEGGIRPIVHCPAKDLFFVVDDHISRLVCHDSSKS